MRRYKRPRGNKGMNEKAENAVVSEEDEKDEENHLYSFLVGGFIVIAIMIIFILLFNH